jgi:hypothetical protein
MPFEIINKPYGDTVIRYEGVGTYTIPLANLGVDVSETISFADISRLFWSTNGNIQITRNSNALCTLHNSGVMQFDELGYSIANNNTKNISVTITGGGSLTMLMSKMVGPAPSAPAIATGSIFIPGTSSRVTMTPGVIVGGTYQTPFTVEGWFFSTIQPGTDSGPVLLSTDTGSGTPAYAKALTVNINSTTQIVVDSNGAAAKTFDFAETMLINTWYYVAVTRDSSGFIQVWLGKKGDTNATASSSGRFNSSINTSAWALTGLSNCIGSFVPAGRFTTGYISNLRVTSTNQFTTTDAIIPIPTEPFTQITNTMLLQNSNTLTDETGNQTLAAVGTSAGNALNPF